MSFPPMLSPRAAAFAAGRNLEASFLSNDVTFAPTFATSKTTTGGLLADPVGISPQPLPARGHRASLLHTPSTAGVVDAVASVNNQSSSRNESATLLGGDYQTQHQTKSPSHLGSDDSDVSEEAFDEGFGSYGAVDASKRSKKQSELFKIGPRAKHTWDGVFMPVALAVLGFVVFHRLPWIIGEAGLGLSLLSLITCYFVSGLTSISLAAISSNGVCGDGGPYMLISRNLGPQFGVTVGVVFVLANVISSALYISGGAPLVLHPIAPSFIEKDGHTYAYWPTVLVATAVLGVLMIVITLKVEKQFRILCLALTLISLIDFIVECLVRREPNKGFKTFKLENLKTNFYPDFSPEVEWRTTLGVLFPGVTGLMAGVCISGELRNPAKAIPRGIMYAWTTSLVIYVIMSFMIAACFDRAVLKSNDRVLHDATFLYVFAPGAVVSAFASVLAGIVGSSRVLLGIAKDDILPLWLFRIIRVTGNPRRAVWTCWLIIQLSLFVGNQYAILTKYTTVVFCFNFLALNLSAFIANTSGLASFRPIYRFFGSETALLGALSAVVVSMVISPTATTIGIVITGAVFFTVEHLIDSSKVTWGDASQPIVFFLVRKMLLLLDERKEHVRHWRPSLLLLVTHPVRCFNTIHFANNFKKGGLYCIGSAVRGDFYETAAVAHSQKKWWLSFVVASGIKAFSTVSFGLSMREVALQLVRGCGLGGMRPNTIMLSLDEMLDRASDDHVSIAEGSEQPSADDEDRAEETEEPPAAPDATIVPAFKAFDATVANAEPLPAWQGIGANIERKMAGRDLRVVSSGVLMDEIHVTQGGGNDMLGPTPTHTKQPPTLTRRDRLLQNYLIVLPCHHHPAPLHPLSPLA